MASRHRALPSRSPDVLFAIARNQLYTYVRRAPQRAQADFAITSIGEIVTSLSSRIGAPSRSTA
jgi:hypothetical protein